MICPKEPLCDSAIRQVKTYLPDRETVVMGQSGVGKSTLLNHLKPGLHLKTNQISKALNRGKHTTRRVHLISISRGLVADTPGFSSYSVLQFDYHKLKNYFPEFVRNASQCKFRECLHFKEPGCEIKALVREGRIMKSRYRTYIHLLKTMEQQKAMYWRRK